MDWISKLNSGSAWTGHMEYARDLVRDNKIKRVLELGTYGGHSLFSFAQGMKDVGIKGEIVSIDLWEGGGDYGSDEMYQNVQKVAEEVFPDITFRFIRKSFNDARGLVKNDYFDLLHIDGCHDYKSVTEDYNNYEKKTKDDAYILFHDTQVKDRGELFEVYKFFAELQDDFPEYEFSERIESYGLGIMKKNGEKV